MKRQVKTEADGNAVRLRRDKECDMATGDDSDLLSGYEAIGRHLGQSPRQAKHLAEIQAIPTFKLPGSSIVRARRSSLSAWLAEREAAARTPAAPEGPKA